VATKWRASWTKRQFEAMKSKPPPSDKRLRRDQAGQRSYYKMMYDPDSAVFGDVFIYNDRKSEMGY
jgi:hypothetical protein